MQLASSPLSISNSFSRPQLDLLIENEHSWKPKKGMSSFYAFRRISDFAQLVRRSMLLATLAANTAVRTDKHFSRRSAIAVTLELAG